MSDASLRIIVVGGGAAGFFAAIAAAEANAGSSISLLERSGNVLAKVRISGGGRCNVTHSCFDPAELITHYPRGGSALRGPFSRFQPRDTVEWFTSRGVALKTEADNRIFPTTDDSATIIDCLRNHAAQAGVNVQVNARIQSVQKTSEGFALDVAGVTSVCDRLILATGSSPQGWEWAKSLGHSLIEPVPSLFTFKISDSRLQGLAGISLPKVGVHLERSKPRFQGSVLITHEGLSGPAILRLSAWAARDLYAKGYQASLCINWTGQKLDTEWDRLKLKREVHGQNVIATDPLEGIPRRLWARLVLAAGVPGRARWTEASNEKLEALAQQLTKGVYEIKGKSTFKEEFVTAGGIPLDEVDFRTMQSKRCPGLFFAGEILDVDAETGGFNFQNAWTTGWIAGHSLIS
jgi:predicted Rossmann fold flavoprotein